MAQLLKPTGLEPVLHKRRATAMGSLHITTREKAHSAIKTQHGHKPINKNKILKKKRRERSRAELRLQGKKGEKEMKSGGK